MVKKKEMVRIRLVIIVYEIDLILQSQYPTVIIIYNNNNNNNKNNNIIIVKYQHDNLNCLRLTQTGEYSSYSKHKFNSSTDNSK
jgi:hypothetical protein